MAKLPVVSPVGEREVFLLEEEGHFRLCLWSQVVNTGEQKVNSGEVVMQGFQNYRLQDQLEMVAIFLSVKDTRLPSSPKVW